MADDLYDDDYDDVGPKKRDNLFIWTVFILLLIGLAFACWLGSFYIFGHPEQARNYRILQRLKKIDPVKRFEVTKGQQGDWQTSKQLFDKYGKYSSLQLEAENAELLRTFVTNYRETKKLVPYMRGNFTIAESAVLTGKDFITRGMVALAVSNEFPQVLIEHLYPMKESEIAKAKPLLVTGNPIKLERTYDLGAVIHIERVSDGRLQFTVIPLLYGNYALSGGAGTFTTEPPADLYPEGGLPVITGERLDSATKKFTEFRRNQPAPEPGTQGDAPPPQTPQIVRLDNPNGTKIPETGSLPEIPVATPIPIAGSPTSRKPPVSVAMLPNTPRPAAPPTPAPNVPPGVFKPFIASNPEPGLPNAQAPAWRTYKPGQVPPGHTLSLADATSLEATPSARTYLQGNFVVNAKNGSRIVLRSRPVGGGAAIPAVRVIVEYGNGMLAPEEGTNIDPGRNSAFEIRDVRKGADGELNIYAREIVQE